jgi:PhzF family phenazine biosynthesis protein
MKIKVFLLNAFGVEGKGGNSAGVVLDAEKLTIDEKKYISRMVGFSETAFVGKTKTANFKVTFFTPTDEVDLCSHATIAVYALLFQKGLIRSGFYTQESNAGTFAIKVNREGIISMDLELPKFYELVSPPLINACLQSPLKFTDLLPQIISTGLRDILLPVPTLRELKKLVVNTAKLKELNKKTNTIGLHAFALKEELRNVIATVRNFAPLYGIEEEAATGSANGALACYLLKYGKLSGRDIKNITFEQGVFMGMPSEISVDLMKQKENVTRVRVGGGAYSIGEKEIDLSERNSPS